MLSNYTIEHGVCWWYQIVNSLSNIKTFIHLFISFRYKLNLFIFKIYSKMKSYNTQDVLEYIKSF